ncbi:hypothetical protein EI94DRAFT_1796329 [Lactarius quietus]|nr:hypothetical protein EI94DRAFT_1796329 [Lactarius quietus]
MTVAPQVELTEPPKKFPPECNISIASPVDLRAYLSVKLTSGNPYASSANAAWRRAWVIFDPVFSKRCVPSQWLGPVHFTDAPCKVEDVPAVDAIVLSHRVPTLRALLANPSSSAYIFVGLNNASYLSRALGTPTTRMPELDWRDERLLRVSLPPKADGPVVTTEVRLSCTPSQHVSARTARD